jgi:hypothetical protein
MVHNGRSVDVIYYIEKAREPLAGRIDQAVKKWFWPSIIGTNLHAFSHENAGYTPPQRPLQPETRPPVGAPSIP